MPYVYQNVNDLQHKVKIGSGQGVALVQHYADVPAIAWWAAGGDVLGNRMLQAGTAIATFEDGTYKNRVLGDHAAFYVKQTAHGIYIMDQSSAKSEISIRFVARLGKDLYGKWKNPANNADAFSVISHK